MINHIQRCLKILHNHKKTNWSDLQLEVLGRSQGSVLSANDDLSLLDFSLKSAAAQTCSRTRREPLKLKFKVPCNLSLLANSSIMHLVLDSRMWMCLDYLICWTIWVPESFCLRLPSLALVTELCLTNPNSINRRIMCSNMMQLHLVLSPLLDYFHTRPYWELIVPTVFRGFALKRHWWEHKRKKKKLIWSHQMKTTSILPLFPPLNVCIHVSFPAAICVFVWLPHVFFSCPSPDLIHLKLTQSHWPASRRYTFCSPPSLSGLVRFAYMSSKWGFSLKQIVLHTESCKK